MRITEAAERLGITPRMLRYRESLGLLPALRYGRDRPSRRSGHRQFTDTEVAAASLGLSIERRYDISPVALAFAIRVLADPRVRTDVAELGRRVGLIQPRPARVLAFEQERAQRLLNLQSPASHHSPRPEPLKTSAGVRPVSRRNAATNALGDS